MDHKVILAVAGSGKTTFIVKDINPELRNIVVAYTLANVYNLEQAIIAYFEGMPKQTQVMSYYKFINSFCYRPILAHGLRTKGLIFTKPPFVKGGKNEREYYISPKGYVYSNRIYDLIVKCKRVNDVLNRIDLFCDKLYFDEIQDYGGHDFSFIQILSKLKISTLFVGDFYQHTYKTSSDKSKNINSHKSIEAFEARLIKSNFDIDKTTLVKSYRCTPTVCNFVKEKLGINMYSHKSNESEIRLISDNIEIESIYKNDTIVKLFIKDHHKQSCYSNNWGLSKGEDKYVDICIILTDAAYGCFINDDFSTLAISTKMKFYVALTRAKRNVYLVNRIKFKKIKEKYT